MKETVNQSMKRVLIPLTFYLIFFTYSLFMLFFGDAGVYAYARINDRIQMLSENLKILNIKKLELTRTIESLRSDPVAMKIEARSMGLYEPDQNVLYFHDFEHGKHLLDTGHVRVIEPISKPNRGMFRVWSLTIGLLFLLFGFVSYKVKNATRPRQE